MSWLIPLTLPAGCHRGPAAPTVDDIAAAVAATSSVTQPASALEAASSRKLVAWKGRLSKAAATAVRRLYESAMRDGLLSADERALLIAVMEDLAASEPSGEGR